MGIWGMNKFLKNNEQRLATKTNLSNTSLVIDASNIYQCLYEELYWKVGSEHNLGDVYGSDLVAYGQSVKRFFENLKRCKIEPILIFDGPIDSNETSNESARSRKTKSYKSYFQEIDRIMNIDESQGDWIRLTSRPPTLKIIFRDIANEAGVKSIQAAHEADTHACRVANELDCLVLTNDADFIIYDLKRGLLMFDLFEYKAPITESTPDEVPSIRCSLVSFDGLARAFPGISKEIMPLFAALLNIDVVHSETVDQLVRQIGPDLRRSIKNTSYTQYRIEIILTWMRGRTPPDAINDIKGLVPLDHQAEFANSIATFMRTFRSESNGDFNKELEKIYPSNKVEDGLIESCQTPARFLSGLFQKDDLNSIGRDMIFHRIHYGKPLLDDHNLPSARCVEFRPYSLALVLLRKESHADLSIYKRRIEADRKAFHIYDRVHGEFMRRSIKQTEYLDNFGELLHLDCYSMDTMEPELKMNMLMACFHFNSDKMIRMLDTVRRALSGPYVQEAVLCFMLVRYIAIETKRRPRSLFVDALMITIFYYAASSSHINEDEFPDRAGVERLLGSLKVHSEIKNDKVYGRKDQFIYRRIMHYISELHCAYRAYYLINALLDHVSYRPRTEIFLNSILVFRLIKLFQLGEYTFRDLRAQLPTLIEVSDAIREQVAK